MCGLPTSVQYSPYRDAVSFLREKLVSCVRYTRLTVYTRGELDVGVLHFLACVISSFAIDTRTYPVSTQLFFHTPMSSAATSSLSPSLLVSTTNAQVVVSTTTCACVNNNNKRFLLLYTDVFYQTRVWEAEDLLHKTLVHYRWAVHCKRNDFNYGIV